MIGVLAVLVLGGAWLWRRRTKGGGRRGLTSTSGATAHRVTGTMLPEGFVVTIVTPARPAAAPIRELGNLQPDGVAPLVLEAPAADEAAVRVALEGGEPAAHAASDAPSRPRPAVPMFRLRDKQRGLATPLLDEGERVPRAASERRSASVTPRRPTAVRARRRSASFTAFLPRRFGRESLLPRGGRVEPLSREQRRTQASASAGLQPLVLQLDMERADSCGDPAVAARSTEGAREAVPPEPSTHAPYSYAKA